MRLTTTPWTNSTTVTPRCSAEGGTCICRLAFLHTCTQLSCRTLSLGLTVCQALSHLAKPATRRRHVRIVARSQDQQRGVPPSTNRSGLATPPSCSSPRCWPRRICNPPQSLPPPALESWTTQGSASARHRFAFCRFCCCCCWLLPRVTESTFAGGFRGLYPAEIGRIACKRAQSFAYRRGCHLPATNCPLNLLLAGRAPRRGCTCCCCCCALPVVWQQMVNTATLMTWSPSTHAIPCLLDCGNRWTPRRPSVQSSPCCCAAPQYTYLSSRHAVTDLWRKLLGLRSAFALASCRPAAPLVSPRSACMTRQLAWFVHRYLTSCRSLFRRRSPLFILSSCYLLNVACHLQRHLCLLFTPAMTAGTLVVAVFFP